MKADKVLVSTAMVEVTPIWLIFFWLMRRQSNIMAGKVLHTDTENELSPLTVVKRQKAFIIQPIEKESTRSKL